MWLVALPAILLSTPPSVRVTGVSALPERVVVEAAETALTRSPDSPNPTRTAVEAILALYRQRGFPVAQVITSETLSDGTLALTVAEGTIRQVRVRGAARTKESVIRAALSLRSGMVYNENRAREDRQRLARLGLFEEIVVLTKLPGEPDDLSSEKSEKTPPPEPPPSDAIGFVDVEVRVKETQTGNVALAVSYADRAGVVGFVDMSEENLLGRGQKASIQWQRTQQGRFDDQGQFIPENTRMAFGASYVLPALGERGAMGGVSVYNKNTVFLPFFSNVETIRSYERRRGGTVQVGQALGKGQRALLTLRRDAVGYDPLPEYLNAPLSLQSSNATVGAIGALLGVDRRDVADFPQSGFLHQLRAEQAGSFFGGNSRFTQWQADLRWYRGTGKTDPKKPSPVIAARLMGGATTGTVPFSEQFFLGGFDLLRGYDLFSVRGTRMLLGSVEGRIPMGQGLQGVLFFDYGDAWGGQSGSTSPNLKSGVGIGARFASPIGPIRFDLAVGRRTQTYVSLGQSF